MNTYAHSFTHPYTYSHTHSLNHILTYTFTFTHIHILIHAFTHSNTFTQTHTTSHKILLQPFAPVLCEAGRDSPPLPRLVPHLQVRLSYGNTVLYLNGHFHRPLQRPGHSHMLRTAAAIRSTGTSHSNSECECSLNCADTDDIVIHSAPGRCEVPPGLAAWLPGCLDGGFPHRGEGPKSHTPGPVQGWGKDIEGTGKEHEEFCQSLKKGRGGLFFAFPQGPQSGRGSSVKASVWDPLWPCCPISSSF